MEPGEVSYYNRDDVRRVQVGKRKNAILNRLKRCKVEVEMSVHAGKLFVNINI